jgi:hypothetical protein
LNAVRELFARKTKPATAATPASASRKRTKSLTCAELEAAIEAACAGLAKDSSTYTTLDRLRYAASGAGEIVTSFDGSVSVAEIDAALTGLLDDVPPGAVSVLKLARAILTVEKPAKRSEPVQFATVAQMKARDAALFDAVGWAIGAFAEEFNRSHPSRAHALDMLGRSAASPERQKLLRSICEFQEAAVRPRTQEEHLRYANTGSYS